MFKNRTKPKIIICTSDIQIMRIKCHGFVVENIMFIVWYIVGGTWQRIITVDVEIKYFKNRNTKLKIPVTDKKEIVLQKIGVDICLYYVK